MDSRAAFPDHVDISVIVPVRGDPRLEGCLAALAAQTLPDGQFEVIVVDNGPDERTRAIVAASAARYVAHPGGGSYAARDRGVAEARGGVLAFTDADCVVPPGWLTAITSLFRDDTCEVAVGPSSAAANSRLSRWVQSIDDRRWRSRAAARGIAFCDTRNLAIRRELLDRVPFDPALRHAGDLDLGMRLQREGVDIRLVESMRLVHHHPASLPAVLRRAVRRGRGLARLERKHGNRGAQLGQRSLRIAGRDAKAALVTLSARRGRRWLLAGVVATSLAAMLPVLWLLLRLPAAESPGLRLFTVFERASLLLGRALG